jgi:hypothetical protein
MNDDRPYDPALDGKEHFIMLESKTRIDFTNTSVFTIQVGKGSKGKYKTKYRLTRDNDISFPPIHSALMWYRGINIGNGYKKRLLVDGKCVARELGD